MRKGFTLIELLVVVLIIGILSSIALPQYQRSVKRARGVEAMTAGRAIADAQNLYYLANGEYEGYFPYNDGENLDIQYPELKYFIVGTGSWGCGGSSCGVGLLLQDAAASNWSGGGAILNYRLSNGKIEETRCYGTQCQDYFTCTYGSGDEAEYCYFN